MEVTVKKKVEIQVWVACLPRNPDDDPISSSRSTTKSDTLGHRASLRILFLEC